MPWSRARDALAVSHGPGVTFFLGTVRPDATPHAVGDRRRLDGRHIVVRDRPADPQGARPRRRPRVHDLVLAATVFGVATAEPHGASRWRFDS